MLSQLLDLSNYYLNPFAVPIFFVSILILSIGFFVIKQNPRAPINQSFLCITLSTGLWLFTVSFVYLSRTSGVAILWYRYFTFFFVCNIMPSLLLFASIWLGEGRQKRYFLIINYLVSLTFYTLAISTDKLVNPYQMHEYRWGFYPSYLAPLIPFLVFFTIQIVITVRKLYRAYKTETIPVQKKSKRIVLVASLIGFASVVDFIPKLSYLPWLYPYGYITMLIYISLIAYAIIKYRTFDIETVIHKTFVWLLSYSFIMVPILLAYKKLFPYMKNFGIMQIIFYSVSFFLVAFYLRVIQPRIDHFFQRRKTDLEAISSRFIEDLVHLKNLNQLIQRIEDTIADSLYPQQINIFIFNEETQSYKLVNQVRSVSAISELDSEDPFLRWLSHNDQIVYREFVDIDPQYDSIRVEAHRFFKQSNAQVVIPLMLNEKLLGMINLARKASLKRYGAAEMHFLEVLKNQSTIAISNSLLYENIEQQVKQRTKELVEVQKQLVQAEKLATMGTLAGGVAHEINNPLTAVLTNVQMLLTAKEIDQNLDRESLELIEEATKRCRTIVQKLMTYAKRPLESMELSKINILDVIAKAISFLEFQLGQENIKVILEAKDDQYLIYGEQIELEQVVTNVILNGRDAIRLSNKGSGEIQVLLSKNNEWIKMRIKDNGAGISKETIPKIFDPFFTTKDVGKGLGLGLSICHSIVEKYKGLITVSSEIGKGTVFTIQFPIARVEHALKK